MFEWTTDKLGAQGTVCAGGRYDGMVKQLGGKATPAVGFAMGEERLLLLLETLNVIPEHLGQALDLYIAAEDKGIQQDVVLIAEKIRTSNPSLRLRTHCSGLKNVLNKARQSGAEKIVLLKKDDQKTLATLWHGEQVQQNLTIDQLIAALV